MLTPVPQQDTGDLDHPQIGGGILVVTYEDGPALRKPAQSALNYREKPSRVVRSPEP